MNRAKRCPGRFPGVLTLKDGSGIALIPSLTLMPPAYDRETDVEGSGGAREKDVFTARFPVSMLEGTVREYVTRALAAGGEGLIGTFDFIIICRDVHKTVCGETRYFAVQYTGVSLLPVKGNRLELRPGARGVAGYIPECALWDPVQMDERFTAE